MNDDFDKHDDDFDWLGDDDDDEQSSSDESGLTGQLSWLDDAESSPDAGRSSDDTDDLDLDWLDQGEDEGAPPSEDATGVTGELSWLSEDTLEDSPDLQVPRSDTKPFWSDADADEEPSESEAPVEDVPDWLRDDESDAEPVESATEEVPDPDEESPGWLANIGETGALSAPDEEDEHPSWLANVGDTGTLNREESEPDLDSPEEADETPDWLSDMGIGQSSAEEDTAEEPAVRDDDPEWLSGLGLESEEETVEPAEEAYPDMDSLFGFDDDVYDEGDTVQPAAQDQDTDWLDQYDEDEEFGIGAEPTFAETSGESSDTSDTDWLDQYDDHREESEEPAVSADDDEAVEKDTGWLEYGEAEEVEYNPYATYEEDFDDDVEYDEVFSSDTSSLVDTGMLTEKSDLFDEEQPVSEAFSEDETPDWLASYSDDEFGEQDEPAPQPAMIESDTEWLDQFDDESFDDADFGEPPLDPLDDVPDWLKGDDNVQEEPESEPEMAEDDLFSDLETDESDHTPTGLTGELEDVDDEEELDFDLLDELDEDITSGSTGLTGELANLDESDFDFLDEIDFDDIDVDDIDLEELTASDLTDELSEIEGDQDQISTGFTGELEAADEDMDLSFLDEVEEEDVEPAETGLTDEPETADEDMDLSFLDEVEEEDVEPAETGLTDDLETADEDMDLSFLDEVEEEDVEPAETGLTDDLETADEDMDLSFLDEVEVSEDAPDRAAAGLTDELEITEAEEELDLSFLDEAEDDERTDWFDESEEVEDREPDWMRTLNEVDVDELVTEAGDRDFEDIFGDADFDVEDEELSDMDVPAADLDSLLATFDDVEEEEFAEDPSLSQADDLDAIFDAALSEQTDEDDLPGHIPEWLRDVDVSSDESSAAAIIRQQSDKPIEELDDRLQALREKALSASSRADEDADHDTPNILSGVPETLAPAHIAHETEELASDITLTSNQQKQAQLLEDIVGVTITPTVETDEEGIPIVESSRRRRRALPNVGLPRLLVALILLLVMILPFVANIQMGDLPPLAFGADNRSANAVFNQIETLQDGDWVLVGFEYAPTAAGELDSVADILLRHIFSQGAQPIIVSSNPVAIVHAQNILDDIHQSLRPSGLGIEANRDYYIVRYLPGGTLGLRDLTQNLESVVGIDAKGTPTRLGLTSLDELALMLVIAERSDDIRNWAEQIVPSTSTRLVAATGYAAQPLAEPYVDQTDGIVGLVVGYRDAYTYGEMLQGVYATATPQPTATFTLTFTPSPTPTMTDTPSPTETPLPTDTPDDTGAQTDDTEQVVPVEATATEVVATETPTLTTTPTSSPTSTATATLTDEPTETATPSPSPSPTPNLITVIVVTAPDASVNVRTGPSTDFNVLTTAQTGDVFQVIGENDDGSWINFLLPDGREGWIAAFLVEKTELPEGEIESDESADTGQGVTVMRVKYHRRMGKNRVRYYQQAPTETPTSTVTGTPPTATPTLTFTPSVTPTATLTPTATPDLRANFVFSREREEENSRLSAMTLGTVAAVIIILFGNIFYGLRVIVQRRRESKR